MTLSFPRALLAALVLGLVVAGCEEQLTAPGTCPATCPGGTPEVRDTILDALPHDTTFAGFVIRGTRGSGLLVSNDDEDLLEAFGAPRPDPRMPIPGVDRAPPPASTTPVRLAPEDRAERLGARGHCLPTGLPTLDEATRGGPLARPATGPAALPPHPRPLQRPQDAPALRALRPRCPRGLAPP